MFFINLLAKIISILHTDGEPKQMAWGFALGTIIGLTPLLALHNAAVACLILLLDVSISAALFGATLTGLIAFLLDPVFDRIGDLLLVKADFLRPFWTALYNMPVAPLTRFYNTVVLGSLVVSLVMLFPSYYGFRRFLLFYRARCRDKVERFKLMKLIKANTIYGWYTKIKSLGV